MRHKIFPHCIWNKKNIFLPVAFLKGSKLFGLLLALLFTNVAGAQQWVQTRGPGGGTVADMVERNGTIIAATLNGLFRTTDNGNTWHRAMNGIPDQLNFHTVTATTNYLWAASSDGFDDLYRSGNNGLSWTPVSNNIGNFFISEIFGSHDTLYLGCSGCGVARSVNEGANFQVINNGYPGSAFVYSFAQIGGNLFTGLRGNGGTPGVYRTSVNSINWVQVNNGLPDPASVIDLAVKGNDLLMTGGNNFNAGLFRSSDLGNSWTALNPGLPPGEIPTVLAVAGSNIYFGTSGDAPYLSVDNGVSFQRVNNGLKQLSVFSLLAGTAGVFVGYERGVARTTDNGASWQRTVTGLTVSSITSLYSDDNTTLYATGRTATVGSSDGVFYTTDGGQNWTSLDEGLLPNPQVNELVKSNGNIIIGTDNYGLYIKTPSDAGFRRATGIPNLDAVTALVSYGSYVLAGISGNEELFRSTDNGLTWTQSNTGFRADLIDQISALHEKNGVFYAGGFDALYKSTDLGVTWTLSNTGIYPGSTINDITSMGNDLYAATGTNGIYKSTDNGATWSQVNNGLNGVPKDITSVNGVLYAATDHGVVKSTNGGALWTVMNDGLQYHNESLSITVFNNRLFLGTDQTAVWGTAPLSALPVHLTSFRANGINDQYIRVSWNTAQESGIEKYIVQRAPVGSNDYVAIGTVAAINSPLPQSYEFTDRQAKRNIRYQYRLQIIEASGVRYSEIETAIISGVELSIRLSPNPTSGIINLLMKEYQGSVSITVTTQAGQTVFTKVQNTSQGSIIGINLSAQPKGVYMIRIKAGNEMLTEKILVQ